MSFSYLRNEVCAAGTDVEERQPEARGQEGLHDILQNMAHVLLTDVGRHTAQHPCTCTQTLQTSFFFFLCKVNLLFPLFSLTFLLLTCEEDGEELEAVEEDVQEEEDDAEVPLLVVAHAPADDRHVDVVEVDSKDAGWKAGKGRVGLDWT